MSFPTFRIRASIAFTLHFLFQFVAWAVADSPDSTKIPWKILSFPLFYALSSWAKLYFWMVGVFNSASWAIVLSLATCPFTRRREAL